MYQSRETQPSGRGSDTTTGGPPAPSSHKGDLRSTSNKGTTVKNPLTMSVGVTSGYQILDKFKTEVQLKIS